MNLEQVATYIREPYKLGLHQAEDLKQLCEDFPYTSVYPLLYLTALSNAKSPALEGALEKYAYRLSDRSRLFDLVSQVSEQKEATISVQQPEETPAEAEIQATQADPEISSLRIVFEEPAEITVSQSGIAETNEPKAEEQSAVTPEKTVEESFEYFTTASSVGQEYFSLEDEEDVEKPADGPAAEIEQPEAESQPEATQQVAPEPETPSGPRSFTDWLKSNGSKPVAEAPGKDVSHSKNALIDRFIETQPTITRQKAEFFSPPKKAKESLNEDAMPVSETLARIFTMQGNYPKAIHVYHQLMLANPEKKTFFAVQIEELKKKLTL